MTARNRTYSHTEGREKIDSVEDFHWYLYFCSELPIQMKHEAFSIVYPSNHLVTRSLLHHSSRMCQSWYSSSNFSNSSLTRTRITITSARLKSYPAKYDLSSSYTSTSPRSFTRRSLPCLRTSAFFILSFVSYAAFNMR